MMAVAVIGVIIAVLYFYGFSNTENKEGIKS